MESEKSILKAFLEGGWLVPLVGAGAMLARMLVSNVDISIRDQFKKILSASISCAIVWFILGQSDISGFHKAITYGIIGVVSPEIIDGLVNLTKKIAKNPEKYIKR